MVLQHRIVRATLVTLSFAILTPFAAVRAWGTCLQLDHRIGIVRRIFMRRRFNGFGASLP